MTNMNNEFYIGWMPSAPAAIARHTRTTVLVILVIVMAAGISLGFFQKKFTSGNFEFGQLATVKGIYLKQPVPLLRIINGRDIFGNPSYVTVPLLGFGKMGAEGIIASMEKEKHVSLDQKEITLKGTLLYNDGKLLLQVDSNDHPLTAIGNTATADLLPQQQSLGKILVKGEIVDPKCYFGVMKPGQGKPHKDCAIRCILGGIPPMLRVVNTEGAANYYLVVGPNGEKINQLVKDFVGEPVALDATAVQYGDWIILYTGRDAIKSISKRELLFPSLTTMDCMATK
jgi:hypothetical protein